MPKLTLTASVNDSISGAWMGTVSEYERKDGSVFYRAYDQADSFIGRADTLPEATRLVEEAYAPPPPPPRSDRNVRNYPAGPDAGEGVEYGA